MENRTADSGVKHRKKRKLRIGWIILLILLVLVIGGWIWYGTLDNPVTLAEPVTITIAEGSGTGTISTQLYEAGLTRHKRAFRIYAQNAGIADKLRPGEYSFSGTVTLEDIGLALTSGRGSTADEIKITIPEGLKVQEIAEIFVEAGLTDYESFMEYAQNGDFPYDYLPAAGSENRLEGFLSPNTYMFATDWGADEIIDLLLAQFDKVWFDGGYDELAAERNMTVLEVITVASMIEKEAVVDAERPIIASVIYNRLAIDMRLQIDATIQFLFDEYKDPLLYSDLEIDSPYNTYKNAGLPPGPIASPGEASIQAALNPASTDYYYYRAKADGSGEHWFSRTLEEHNSYAGK